ncbi:LLM class flavin-dependent oxidoreductase [Euzebya sp.]|uniref:LLM class flavin-dependent oxidoreductase n=1 Tax=Euzebya sp. TaxID=1971409 RepID=UPI003518DBF5
MAADDVTSTRGIGLSLPNRGVLFGATTTEEMIALTERADASPHLDSVWVGDGLVAKARLESVVALSAIAARTSRVRLGVCCLATFPLRQPVLFAVQWASLDLLSGGRTQLAVCLGAPTARSGTNPFAELDAMGIRREDRVPRLEEGIAVLRALWAGPAAFDGTYTSFPEIDLQPRPVQQPCPIWIASNPNPAVLSPERYAAAIDRVGRLADGWQSTVVTPEDFGVRWAEVRESAGSFGRDPDAMTSSVHLMINLHDDVAAARAEAKTFLDTYYSMDVSDDVMDAWGAYGPPDVVLERLSAYVDAGLDVPILRFASYDQQGQLDRADAELLGQLRDLLGVTAAGRPA